MRTGANENEYNDGLTAECLALLTRAHLEAGVELPAAIRSRITEYLRELSTRPASFPVSIGITGAAFTDHKGRQIEWERRDVRCCPWSVPARQQLAAVCELERLPHDQAVRCRRALNHLLMEVGPVHADEVEQGACFAAAESAVGLDRGP